MVQNWVSFCYMYKYMYVCITYVFISFLLPLFWLAKLDGWIFLHPCGWKLYTVVEIEAAGAKDGQLCLFSSYLQQREF